MTRRYVVTKLRAIATVILTLISAPAHAADFYAGKTINLIVGDGGGGYSLYARAIAKHLGRHITGSPVVVVKTMPGAGGSTAAAYLYRIAPADGTAILSVPPGAMLRKLLGDRQIQYDPAKFVYLAGAERGVRLCMTFQHSKVKTFQDALARPAVIGASTGGSPTRDYAAMYKNAAAARFDIVSGYKGPPDLFIAMERGEIDGACGLDWAVLKAQQPRWLEEKKLNLLVQGSLESDPELAALGVPTPWPYIRNDVDRKAVELMIGFQQAFGKAYLAPPGTPAEQVRLLREGFGSLLHDGEFLAEAHALRIDIVPQTGEDVQRAVATAYASDEAVTERLKKILEP
jgi:tripartite-type tricarboxylate transporter receptor subunit TctC